MSVECKRLKTSLILLKVFLRQTGGEAFVLGASVRGAGRGVCPTFVNTCWLQFSERFILKKAKTILVS